MPATRGQIRREKIVAHTVDFGDDVQVTFTFDANKMTDAWMDEWTRHEQETNTPQLNGMLKDLIVSWDILEDEGGVEVPVTVGEIGKLFSLRDKVTLIREFIGLPSDAEGNASANTSSSPTSTYSSTQESHQTGPSMSQTPEPAASPSTTVPT